MEKKNEWRLSPLDGSRNVSVLPGRGNKIAVASMESQDAMRGFDISLAHLSEVAFWRSSDRKNPEDFVRAICGSILYGPETLVVMESTANGTGNYFHREWLRSVRGDGDKIPVFVAWHEIELYSLEVNDAWKLWEEMDDYERNLWEEGLTLEQINWYHNKRKEYASHRQMMAEFPSNATEAFVHSESNVFAMEHIDALRSNVCPEIATGELEGDSATGPGALTGLRFRDDSNGCLRIWEFPDNDESSALDQRYVVGVDIGGVSAGADWSVISVMDCGITSTFKPRIVATWRGHIDHDLLAWKCASIAKWYCNGLLVIESNTLEQEKTQGDPTGYILEKVGEYYPNLYYRREGSGRGSAKPGFHVNRSSKTHIVTSLIAAVREGAYVERDEMACDELSQYEHKANGGFGARDGCHDDVLMTRALILGTLSSRCVTDRAEVRKFVERQRPWLHASRHERDIEEPRNINPRNLVVTD